MTVTLWGDRARMEDSAFANFPVICLKGVLVKAWGEGRMGSLLSGGQLELEAKRPEVERVRDWWRRGGSTQSFKAISTRVGHGSVPEGKRVSIAEMRQASEHIAYQPEVFTLTCRLALVQLRKQGEPQPLLYSA